MHPPTTEAKSPPFHCNVSTIRRSRGENAVQRIAYVTGLTLYDSRTGQTFIRGKRGVATTVRFGAEEVTDQIIAAAFETAEKRKNAVVGRQIEFALPRMLPFPVRQHIVAAFARFVSEQLHVVTFGALHDPGEPNSDNWHGHLVFSPRAWDEAVLSFGAKTRVLDVTTSGAKVIKRFRKKLAELINRHLEKRLHVNPGRKKGRSPRRKHLGPEAHRMERCGIKTVRGDYNRLVDRLEAVEQRIREVEQAIATQLRKRSEKPSARVTEFTPVSEISNTGALESQIFPDGTVVENSEMVSDAGEQSDAAESRAVNRNAAATHLDDARTADAQGRLANFPVADAAFCETGVGEIANLCPPSKEMLVAAIPTPLQLPPKVPAPISDEPAQSPAARVRVPNDFADVLEPAAANRESPIKSHSKPRSGSEDTEPDQSRGSDSLGGESLANPSAPEAADDLSPISKRALIVEIPRRSPPPPTKLPSVPVEQDAGDVLRRPRKLQLTDNPADVLAPPASMKRAHERGNVPGNRPGGSTKHLGSGGIPPESGMDRR